MISEGIIATLKRWGDLRDISMEHIFLTLYSSPLLQALVGLRAFGRAAAPTPRRRTGADRLRPATHRRTQGASCRRRARRRRQSARGVIYIGMAGPGVDERAFNELRRIRAEHGDLTFEESKRSSGSSSSPCCWTTSGAGRNPEDVARQCRSSVRNAGGDSTGRVGSWRGHRRTRETARADREAVPGRRIGRTGYRQV